MINLAPLRLTALAFALACVTLAGRAPAQQTTPTLNPAAHAAPSSATLAQGRLHFPPPRILAMDAADRRSIRSGKLRLTQYENHWGGLLLSYERTPLAATHDHEWMAYRGPAGPVWVDLAAAGQTTATLSAEATTLTQTMHLTDPDGAQWKFTRTIAPAAPEGTLAVNTTIQVDTQREVLYLPILTFFPGFLMQDATPPQLVFPGVAWQDGVPGDFVIPDPAAIATPLMAVASRGRWFALAWEPDPRWGAACGAPDPLYRSGAAVCALMMPGADRVRGAEPLIALRGERLEPAQPVTFRALLMGGTAPSLSPALQRYVAARGLPAPPSAGKDIEAVVDTLAAGWFNPQLYQEGEWRSSARADAAPFYPAADAILSLRWLARNTANAPLASIISERADLAEKKYPADDPWLKLVAPLSATPAIPLMLGRIDAYLDQRTSAALQLAARADSGGLRGRNKPSDAASSTSLGITATSLAYILETASLTGDDALTTRALAMLKRYNDQFGNTLPTFPIGDAADQLMPNPLGAAAMIHANLTAHELTGRANLVENARQWAWRGLAFVRLAEGERAYRVQPTQWCGLVYAAALQRLHTYDPENIWNKVAAGIARQSLAMSGVGSKATLRGMLPELADPVTGRLGGRALAPAHVQSVLSPLYEQAEAYSFLRLSAAGWLVHSPCQVTNARETPQGAELVLAGCGSDPYHVLIARVAAMPSIVTMQQVRGIKGATLDTGPLEPAPFTYDAEKRRLIVDVTGRVLITIHRSTQPPAPNS